MFPAYNSNEYKSYLLLKKQATQDLCKALEKYLLVEVENNLTEVNTNNQSYYTADDLIKATEARQKAEESVAKMKEVIANPENAAIASIAQYMDAALLPFIEQQLEYSIQQESMIQASLERGE